MGKQRRQRRKPHRENPTGLSSVKHFEEVENFIDEDREKALEKVLEEVQSPKVEEKLSGLQTLESMSCDARMAAHIAQSGIAKIIGPLLLDHSIVVQSASACALRCIADHGGHEAYTRLLNDDIMTPLSGLLKKYNDWQPKPIKDQAKGAVDDEKETFIQAVTLLWTLGENNESVIKHLNQENLIPIIIKYLDVSTYGTEISVIAAQCMLSLSEENPAATDKLIQCKESLIGLLNLEVSEDNSSEVLPLKILAAGLLMNILNDIDNDVTHIVNKVILVVSEVLSYNHETLLHNLISNSASKKEERRNNSKKKVQNLKKILGAQQQALEILANVCIDDQDTDEESDLDSEQGEESDPTIDDPISDKSLKMITTLPVELTEIIVSSELPNKVWSKTEAIHANTQTALQKNIEGSSILKQIHTLRCRAYLCLNNLIGNLDIDSLGGVENTYSMWTKIGTVVFKHADLNDIELLESATAAMRALLEKLAEAHTNKFQQLQMSDIQSMLNGERQCPNANIRANLLRILGNLTLILINVNDLQNHELVKHITTFLIDACKTESEVWVIAESLDAIMDIYAEDETDILAANIELIPSLQSLVSSFKHKVRQQKKTLGDKMSIVSTVNTNLTRFIKYKGNRIKNLQ